MDSSSSDVGFNLENTVNFAGGVREVGRRQRLGQPLPGHHGLHLGQEPLATGDLLLVLVLSLGERDLLHRLALVRRWQESQILPRRWLQGRCGGIYAAFP